LKQNIISFRDDIYYQYYLLSDKPEKLSCIFGPKIGIKCEEVIMSAERKVSRTPVEILQIALKKEESSFRLYDNMLQETKVGFVRELIERLREEESKHVRMIRQRIARLEMGRG